jgi:hypothetical protein
VVPLPAVITADVHGSLDVPVISTL